MNLAHDLEFFANQGPIYWAAAAAVAVGGALLLTSGVVLMRRLLRRIRPAGRPAVRPRVRVTETGYAADLPAKAAAPAAAAPTPMDLQALRDRLETAAGRLESVRDRLNAPSGQSALKGSRTDVEYVFRAGIG